MNPQVRTILFTQYFPPSFRAGGPVRSNENIVKMFDLAGVDFKVITSFRDLDGAIYNRNPDDQRIRKFGYILAVIGVIQANKVVVNSVFSFRYSIFPILLAILFGKIIFIIPRGELFPSAVTSGRKVIKHMYLKLFKLIKHRVTLLATSRQELNLLRDESYVRSMLFPNMRFDLLDIPKVQKDDPDIVRFGILGRIKPIKNQLFVVANWKASYGQLVLKGFPEDGSYFNELNQFKDHFILLPETPDVDMFFRKIDALIVPSLSENYCHSAYEASARGLPVIHGNNLNIDLPVSFQYNWKSQAALRDCVQKVIDRKRESGELTNKIYTATQNKLKKDIQTCKEILL